MAVGLDASTGKADDYPISLHDAHAILVSPGLPEVTDAVISELLTSRSRCYVLGYRGTLTPAIADKLIQAGFCRETAKIGIKNFRMPSGNRGWEFWYRTPCHTDRFVPLVHQIEGSSATTSVLMKENIGGFNTRRNRQNCRPSILHAANLLRTNVVYDRAYLDDPDLKQLVAKEDILTHEFWKGMLARMSGSSAINITIAGALEKVISITTALHKKLQSNAIPTRSNKRGSDDMTGHEAPAKRSRKATLK